MNLEKEFLKIKAGHEKAIQNKTARIVVGPSVGRVFKRGTKNKIRPFLENINLAVMKNIRSQLQYKKWFEKQLHKLAAKIKEANPNNERIYPGYKWGHSTKILCLFMNDIIIHRNFFDNITANRIIYFLYTPIDGIVMGRLNELAIKLDFCKIKEIDAPEKFYNVQNILTPYARRAGIPRIWFDDIWANR